MHKIHKVASIINDDIRPHFKDTTDMCLILLCGGIVPRENIQSGLNQGCSNVILSGKRIASRDIHLSSSCRQDLAKICSLGFKMNRERHLQPLERLRGLELLFQRIQKRHVMSYPINFKSAFRPELLISYFACHIFFVLRLQR